MRDYYSGERRCRTMAVDKVGEHYRCNICGNEVTVTVAGGGTLVCCGEDMELVS
jgi:desulfoferrodoxin-like iron-binding protein